MKETETLNHSLAVLHYRQTIDEIMDSTDRTVLDLIILNTWYARIHNSNIILIMKRIRDLTYDQLETI